MRHLLAAALVPTPSTSARDLVSRSFWRPGGKGASETVDLAARRAVAKADATDEDALHFVTEE